MSLGIQHANENILDNVVIPEAFLPPEWVEKTFEIFREEIHKEYQKNKHIPVSTVRKLIKDIIFDGRVTPNYPLNKKNISILLEKMYNVFGDEEFQWRYMLLYKVGFFLSTYSANSFTPDALELPDQFKPKRQKIIKEYQEKLENAKTEKQKEEAIIWVDKAFKKLANEVLQYFRDNREDYPIIDTIDSGAKGSPDDLRKLLVAIGLSINAKGEINDIIDRSGSEGLTPTQFFNYTSQAIVSQYKKSKDTAIPGYLIRKLNTVMSNVKLSKENDCGTNKFLSIKILNKEMLQAMVGKMRKTPRGLIPIEKDDTDLIGKTVQIRSPLYCKSKDGICKTCYNPVYVDRMNLTQNAGIGLLASTAQAGMLTNMTLKAAHIGLSLNKEEVDLSKDIFEYSE